VSDVRLYLFDDGNARRWAPFTLTRPAGELRYGCLTFRERAQRVFGLPCAGQLSRRALAGFDEPGAAPVVARGDVPPEPTRILLSSRAVPEFQDLPELVPGRLTIGGETVGWILGPGEPLPSEGSMRAPASATEGSATELTGEVLARPWNLVSGTPARVAKDVAHLFLDDHQPEGVIRIGNAELSMGVLAEVEPGVVMDTRHGPIRLDDGVRVEGPARLVGPLYVGRDSMVLGGHVATSSLGPMCKVRGELSWSVFLGWDNKAHDGYVGHAMLGRWVNLGAGTTNSDLKNTYGTIRVWTPDGEQDSKLVKVGCFLGDHVKIGVGTLLNTGTVIGAGSNVFGGEMPPTVVPPFAWGAGIDLRDYRFDQFVRVAEAAMARRGEALTPGVRRVFAQAWQNTRTRRAE
jgi:UDP-N-acetylglucosamine diphosphorylase / glucose-1-phosphate thymidylyltransferase / UDP-N-acetylgalactosamine diphosphorylase / glucosamine-1-phosphate N-acetyltransferase / galactosamine-1-phosphate N-acetyltransferase